MIVDEQWPVARLIPISSASGVEAQERRAASALLAVIHAVPEFGRALLKPLGAPAGRIDAFIEVPFKFEGKALRPDGIITVQRGGKSWTALVETKVGSAVLEATQMEMYLDLAKELSLNAVLSISNQFISSSRTYPIELDKRKLRKVSLHHWSWVNVLTEAVIQKEHRGVSDPDQAYILNELIRYLSDPRSGALTFESMGPSWTKIKDGARQATLRKNNEDVAAIAARWDDLTRYLGLELTKDLGRDVKQVLPKTERLSTGRQAALQESLANAGRLYSELQVPDVAGALQVVADLRARQVIISSTVDAPKEGRSKGRVSWLLRQLNNSPDDLRIEARVPRTLSGPTVLLEDARRDPSFLYPEGDKEIRQFVLSLTRNMGLKRDASKGSFIHSVISTTEDFYRSVLQNLRPWKAAPPKLKKAQEVELTPEEGAVDLPEPAAKAVMDAAQEMRDSENQV